MSEFNKNERQQTFNQVRGIVTEINKSVTDFYSSITLNLGHENPRPVNLTCKKVLFDKAIGEIKIGDKVEIRFFLSSRYKNTRWHTFANILEIKLDPFKPQDPEA